MNLEKASVQLAFLLRHCKNPVYIDPDGGWADTQIILKVLGKTFPGIDRQALDTIVAMDKKGRYSYDPSGRRIRANQGHSIPGVVVEMTRAEPPEILYHGTSDRFLSAIERDGLKPMTRQFVHISPDYATAVAVGRRHGGRTVILKIRAWDFVKDGNMLYLSANGVWQTKAVPPRYFTAEYAEQDD